MPWDWLGQLQQFLNGLWHWATDWLMELLKVAWNGLVDQVPTITLPTWWGDMVAGVGQVMALMGQMSFWVPVDVFLPAVLAVAAAFAVALAIRIARIVASFATLGGGS